MRSYYKKIAVLLLTVLFALLNSSSLKSQVVGWSTPATPPPYGVFSMGTSTAGSSDIGRAVCTDASGNVYLYGTFGTGTDFDPGPGVTGLTSSGATAADLFVAKYNSAGALQWVVRGGVLNSTDNNGGNYGSIVSDGTNVYVVGQMNMTATNTADFAPAAGGCTCNYAPGATLQQGFVAKLSASSGQWQWVNTWGSATSGSGGHGVCLDPTGNIYITGQCNGNINVGPSPFTTTDAEAFFAKLTPAGAWTWTNHGGGTGADGLGTMGGSISYNPFLTRITCTGSYASTGVTFGSFGVPNSTGVTDIYITEINPATGAFLNAFGFGSVNVDEAANCYDPNTHDIFLAGLMGGNISGLPGVGTLNQASAGNDIFVARYTPNATPSLGTITWAKSYGGPNADRAWGVSSDGLGSIIFCGNFLGTTTIDFGAGAATQVTSTSTTGGEIFVASVLASNGNGNWAVQGRDNNTGNDQARGICALQNGTGISYSTGQIGSAGTVSMTPSSLGNSINLTSQGGSADIFFGKVFGVLPLTAIQSQTNLTCNGVCTGSATVVASGGIAPYTYSWSPSGGSGATASNLCAINYTCTITDATSSSITKTFTLTQPPAISITTNSQTNVSCFGGSNGAASVSASGGTGTLTYNWTPGNPTGDGTGSVTGLTAQVYTVTVTDANLCTATRTFNITQPPVLAATPLSQTNVSCFGGSNGAASISVSGGAGGNTYNWTPGNPTGDGTTSVTGLTAQGYTCTVTDVNSCVSTATFNITAPSALTVSPASQTNISCNGGSNGAASVTVSGGTTSYSYNWTPGNPTGDGTASVTGLTAQGYTCTVTDANSCVSTATFNITAPSALVVTPLSQTNVSCGGGNNGAASVSVSGGTTSYSYNWTPGNPTGDGTASVTGLTAGAWTCTVTDANSCVNTATFNITAPSAIVVTPVSQTNISCNGGSNGAASVSASGGTGTLTYNWTPGNPTGDGTNSVTGLTAGTWTCTVTDANSCTNTATFNITAPSAIAVTPVSQTNISCNGGSNGAASVSASGGTGTLTYNWTPGNPTGDGTNAVTGLTAGTWTCTVTDANSCVNTATFNITAPSALVVSPASQTNVSCNGGSNGAASVNVSGGTTSYSYNWTPGNPTGDGTASVTGLAAGAWTCTVTDANSCVNTATFNITAPSALVVSPVSQTNVSCNGGSNGAASVNVSGGTTSYSYNWTPGNPTGDGTASVTGLTAGTWTCTVTDANSCVNTATFNITAPSAIAVTPVSQTNISCNGGSNGAASVSASGGTGTLTYNWTPGNPTGDGTNSVTGLTAGTWTCTVTDANSCVNTATFNITAPTAITAGTSSTPESCAGNDGTATVTPSGGAGSFTFSWAPSGGTGATANGLSAGTYTCTITDANSCVATPTVAVTGAGGITAAITASSDVSCNAGNDGSATAAGSGGTGTYTYAWAPSGGTNATASSLSSGTYTCTVTDGNGCSATATVNITQPTAISASVSSQTNISCNGGNDGAATISASGGTGTLTYSWAPLGGNSATASSLSAGTYTCTITDANSCFTTRTVNITQPTAISASASSQTNISCNGGNDGAATISASGGTGTLTYSWAPSGGNSATASSLSAGTYTCTITDANSCFTTRTVNITQPSAITAGTSSTPESCAGNDGTATVSASGGTGTLTYSWAPSGGTASTANGLSAGTYTCTITDANSCVATPTVAVTGTAGISASITSSTNVSCNGANDGAATVAASGGSGTYSYSWAPSGGNAATASGLGGGTYTCTVTDVASSCITTVTVMISEPAVLTVNAGGTSPICTGQSTALNATPSGGTGPYNYTWMPGSLNGASVVASPSSTTVYTVSVTDAHGCSTTGTVNIVVNTTPTITVVSNPTSGTVCTNTPATLTANGAASYSWTGGVTNGVPFTPPATATYTVTGTAANGCQSTATRTITVQNCNFQTQLTSAYCGATNVNISGSVSANTVQGATNYEFLFVNTPLGYSQSRQKGNGIPNISLSWILGLQYGTTYQVQVRPYVNGVWQPYGPVCSITLESQVPTTQLANCAATNLTLSNSIAVVPVASAQDYEYEVTNAQQPYSTLRQMGSPTTSINLTWFADLQYGRTYNVRVRAKVGGVWGAFGNTCTFTMQATAPPTQLTTLCGASGVTSSSVLAWSAVTGATNYRVNIANTALGYSQTKVKGSNGTTMGVSQFNGLVINNTYTVTISSYIGGAWSPFGPACTITMGASVRINPGDEDDTDFNFGISMYPNPVMDGVNPTVTINGADQRDAIVTVMDLTGRVVATYQLFVDSDEYAAELTNFPDLVAGMYIMQVQIGEKVQSQKFIAQ